MTYIDDIVAFTATAEPSADGADWTAVRSAVDAATTENTDVGDAETAYAVGCAVAERVAAVLDSASAARGWSRRSVEAALLVSHGFTSSADGLSGRRGLFALMAPGSASW